jgi:hypothetical protein
VAQLLDFLLQPRRLCLNFSRLGSIGGLQGVEIPLDALLDLLLALVYLARREIAVPTVAALNLLLSMATIACENNFKSRQSETKRRQTFRIPRPLS